MADFRLKQVHIDMIRRLHFHTDIDTEYNDPYIPAINRKRPFGNSGVIGSVMEILGIEPDSEGNFEKDEIKAAENLLIELPVALEIVTRYQTFKPGVYEVGDHGAYFQYLEMLNHHALKDALDEIDALVLNKKEIVQRENLHRLCSRVYGDDPWNTVLQVLSGLNQTRFVKNATAIFEKYMPEKTETHPQTLELYHITDPEKIESILKHGLKPNFGENSEKVDEQVEGIYLCDQESLPFWQIILGKTAAMKMRVPYERCSMREYACYSEYICDLDVISPDMMEPVSYDIVGVDEGAMHQLCMEYLYSFSYACESAASYDKWGLMPGVTPREREEIHENLRIQLMAALAVTDKLDYNVTTDGEVREWAEESSEDGMFTFLDYYKDTGLRLCEKLLDYPEDDLTDMRKALGGYLISTFKNVMDAKTGGWTG